MGSDSGERFFLFRFDALDTVGRCPLKLVIQWGDQFENPSGYGLASCPPVAAVKLT